MKTGIFIIFCVCSLIRFTESATKYGLRSRHLVVYDGYKIDYNFSIGQANYALYQPALLVHKGGCLGSNWIDGYNYTYRDYNGFSNPSQQLGIDRGHLATYASLGVASCNMNNIVPMNSSFNRGEWRTTEYRLRVNHKNHWVATGCKYRESYVVIHNNKLFHLIEGCYYVVFDNDPVNSNVSIIENGYISIYKTSNKDLPWWVTDLGLPHNDPSNHTYAEIIGIFWFPVLCIAVLFMMCATAVIIALPKKQ
jgi:hypothetical protein